MKLAAEIERLALRESMHRRRFLQGLGGVVGGTIVSSAWVGSAMAQDKPAPRDTLVFAAIGGAEGFDPNDVTTGVRNSTMPLQLALYDMLFWLSMPKNEEEAALLVDKGGVQPEGQLVEAWDIAQGGKIIRLSLRNNAVSNYGNTLTADDVLWSMKRAFEKKFIAFGVGTGAGLEGPSSFVKIDDNTVEIRLESPPMPYLLQALSLSAFAIHDSVEAQKHVTAEDPTATQFLLKNSAGFGPYKIASWQPRQQTILERNPGYWREHNGPSRIVHQGVSDASQRLQLLLSGAADVSEELTPLQLEAVSAKDGYAVTELLYCGDVWIPLRNDKAPFDNPDVRRGLAYAIPYDEILAVAFRGRAKRWKSHLTPWYQGGSSVTNWPYEYDPDKARALLAPLQGQNLTLSYAAGSPIAEPVAIRVQQGLRAAGVEIQIEALPRQVYDDRKSAGELEFFINETDAAPIPSALLYFKNYLATDSIRPQRARYANAQVIDNAIAQYRATTDPLEQNAILKVAMDQLAEDMPFIPIAQASMLIGHKSDVDGVGIGPAFRPTLHTLSVKS